MEIRPTSAGDHAAWPPPLDDTRDELLAPLAELLWGSDAAGRPLPPLGDLMSAAIGLATARDRKCLLRLPGRPAEVALVRRGETVRVCGYETGSAPDVWVLDRRIPLRDLLDTCAVVAHRRARRAQPGAEREATARLADRIASTAIAPDLERPVRARRRGGALESPGEDVPLAFGFEARIVPCALSSEAASARADVHALLFDGSLFTWVRGRRIQLAKGPIMLCVQRMVAAVHALVDAAEAERAANVRLRSGGFQVGVRLSSGGAVALTLGADGGTSVTIPALGVAEAALPILRLGSDVVRALVSADRGQARNLRVRAFREEVRALRRRVRARERADGFVNRDPDRLRAAAPLEPAESYGTAGAQLPGRLRFAERWSTSVDELDAASTFLCGDRLIVATPRRALALSRDDGRVLWVREGTGGGACMVGRTLVRLAPSGMVELCDVADGEAYATTRLAPRVGAPLVIGAGGGALPPLVVVAEGESRLSAIDVRNAEPLWRFSARTGGPLRLRRVGRILLVASGEGAIDAIDAASGEIAWRFADRTRFCFAPAVCRDVVLAGGGEPGGRSGTLVGIDLYTGEMRWRRRIAGAPAAGVVATGTAAALAIGGPRRGSLASFHPGSGELRWMVPDPGVGAGGACMTIDRTLLINAPAGRLTSLDLDTGETRWARDLADPVADDVPRRLEPVLRSGALFVPAATVHILRPTDGTSLGTALPCDLVPDLLRVDERGWVYVAEESGHLAAHSPVTQLTLV